MGHAMGRQALLVILLLAGCSLVRPQPAGWERADATPEQAANDLQACRQTAQAKIDRDQLVSQDAGADPTSQGTLADNLSQYDAEKRVNAMTRDCMIALDYHPADTTTP
jgi:hypothetical protein